MKEFKTAWLTTNRNCNNNCSWCYAKNTLANPKKMDFEHAKLAVDELKRRGLKKVVLIGGEPTIYPHFFELVQYIHKQELRVAVASNGRKFADIEFAKKAKEAGVDHVDVSIKAVTESEYYASTNARGLKEMLEGYHNLRALEVGVSASYVIVDDDKNKFDEFVSFLERENFKSVLIQFVKPALSLEKKDEIMKVDAMGRFVSYIYERMSKSKVQYTIEVSFPICLIEDDVWDKLIAENRVSNCCHVPKGTGINLDEEFRVIPCNHFAEFPFSDTPVDFSNPAMLDELYESQQVKKFRELARGYTAEKCVACERWKFCGGGCFTRWLFENPEDYIK